MPRITKYNVDVVMGDYHPTSPEADDISNTVGAGVRRLARLILDEVPDNEDRQEALKLLGRLQGVVNDAVYHNDLF